MPETRLPIITLTTDFGTEDHYVAAMKASILSISTQLSIVDVTHDVSPHDIREAGWVLRNAFQAFPRHTVHVAVADPGVGTDRRAILAVTENHYFLGPDNGIFSFVFEAEPPLHVYEITAAHYRRPEVSATFHARDIFAPAAAHLARGAEPSNFGEPVENPVRLDLPRPKVTQEGTVRAAVAHVDRFGNVILNLTRSAIGALMEKIGARAFTAKAGATTIAKMAATYGEGPSDAPFLLFNSSDFLEIAANRSRACDIVGLKTGDTIELTLVQQAAQ